MESFFKEIDHIEKISEHPCISYASLRKYFWDQGKKIELMIYQTPIATDLIEWWKQLFAESEGKENKGLFPSGALYSKDLHSLGQYIQQGTPIVFETFLEFEHQYVQNNFPIESRLRVPNQPQFYDVLNDYSGRFVDDIRKSISSSSKRAHEEGKIPNISLKLQQLDEFNLGYLMSFFMTSCSLSAFLLGVNPFNQPGVENYKKEILNILK